MSKKLTPPEAPAYLPGTLRDRFDTLAPVLTRMGTLSRLDVDVLAKYVLAENEYLRVSNNVQAALSSGDVEDANKWLAAQDRLTKQCLTLAAELGLTAKSRTERGLIIPEN